MIRIVMTLLLALMLTACSDRPKELYETAQFEEVQRNFEHAGELYLEIIEEYPDSPYAAKARENLTRMDSERQGVEPGNGPGN